MTLNDMERESKKVPFYNSDVKGFDTQWNAQATNELTFLHGFADLSHMPAELFKYLPLFSVSFGGLGTEKYTYSELSQRKQNYTGGVSSKWTIHNHFGHAEGELEEIGIQFGSSALERNIQPMFEILKDICTLEPLGVDQLKSLVQNVTITDGIYNI